MTSLPLTVTRLKRAIALTVAVAGLAGCGGGDDSTSTTSTPAQAPSGTTAKLAAYLPTDAPLIAEVDVAAARRELGLDPDADATDIEAVADAQAGLDDPSGELVTATATGIPPVTSFLLAGEKDPFVEALDGSEISAAVSNQSDPDGPVSVIATSQSFEDLASKLEDGGYERDGDTLTDPSAVVAEVASAGNGVVVATGKGASATDLIDSPPGGPAELTSLLDFGAGSMSAATAVTTDQSSCVTALGARGPADATGGTARLQVDGTADAANVDTVALNAANVKPGEPKADGDTVEIPFTAPPQPGGNPVGQVLVTADPAKLYDCG